MSSQETIIQEGIPLDQVQVVRMENEHLVVDISPETGGRTVSIFNKPLGLEFLWKNEHLPLQRVQPGEPYDPNFSGGIDEVIPGDLPELIGERACPDHGELWSLPMEYYVYGQVMGLHALLPVWGLHFHKRITLRPGAPWIDMDYRIENRSGQRREFLWKLHAAAAISPGDWLVCPAQTAVAADPRWSRWKSEEPFDWPMLKGQPADRIPPADGTTDFLFLYGLRDGQLSLQRPALGGELRFEFDRGVFPYVCYFASYGGFDGHYTAVLEPSTAMPLSVNEAARLGQCSVLEPGAQLKTRVSIYAGPLTAR